MKKSWIIVLAFVFLYSAVPAFSKPVPSELCLELPGGHEYFALILESKGTVADVEYWEVNGTHDGLFSIVGTAKRLNKRMIEMAFGGAADVNVFGPGDGYLFLNTAIHLDYHLKKKTGNMSYLYLQKEGDSYDGTSTVSETDCSSVGDGGGPLAPGLSSYDVP